uniref:Uncharacterized protein n=1 Tax=Lepeophtheirus salmonis TaxID=72036 RepID=A0A0K2T4K9_LEPSM
MHIKKKKRERPPKYASNLVSYWIPLYCGRLLDCVVGKFGPIDHPDHEEVQ